MASEPYVRPPLIAREADPAAARWRFRLAAAVLLLALVVVLVVLFQQLVGTDSQNPGFVGMPAGPQAGSGISSSATVPGP